MGQRTDQKLGSPARYSRRKSWIPALRTAGIYMLLATLWILTSDLLTGGLNLNPSQMVYLSIAKGIFFVTVTSVLLALLIRRDLATVERSLARQRLLTEGAERLRSEPDPSAAWFIISSLVGDYARAEHAEVWRMRAPGQLAFDGVAPLSELDDDEYDLDPTATQLTRSSTLSPAAQVLDITSFEFSSAWKDAEETGRALLRAGVIPPALRRHPSMQSVEVIPVATGAKVYGAILLWRRSLRGTSSEDIKTIKHLMDELADTQHRGELEESIEYNALYDAATGLPNRTLFMDRLRAALLEARESGSRVLVLRSKVDLYDRVSDSIGHEAAERLMKEAAHRLGGLLGPRDTLARTQAAEFQIAVRYERKVEAGEFVDRLSLATETPVSLGESAAPLSLSSGVYLSEGSESADEIIRDTATALSRAKLLGRGRMVYFEEDMRRSVEDALHTEVELRQGLENGEIETFFQPMVEAATTTTVGAEALVRWRHPERGLVPPAEFISIAEESGLIVEMGRLVLKTACEQCFSWPKIGGIALGVSVNFSAVEFLDEGLQQRISDALDSSGLSPERLTVEITETALMLDPDLAQRTMDSLQSMGVRVALDDFGTQYSSLSYLQQFSIDLLKIDASFVSRTGSIEKDRAIACAVIGLAHTLGLKAVAEGVETETQAEFLRSQGCDYLQGYLFGKPVPAEEFRAQLTEKASALV